MTILMLVVGSVTSKQYTPARLDLVERGLAPKVERISAPEWEMAGFNNLLATYTAGNRQVRAIMRSAYFPVAPRSRLLMRGSSLARNGGHHEALPYVIRTNFAPPAGVVRAVVIAADIWFGHRSLTNTWRVNLPSDVVYWVPQTGGKLELMAIG